jgi:hypothetical protein
MLAIVLLLILLYSFFLAMKKGVVLEQQCRAD